MVLFILRLVTSGMFDEKSSPQTLKRTPASDVVSFGGSALNVLADKGSSSLVSAARVPPDTPGTS